MWQMLDKRMTLDHLGLLAHMLSEHNPKPAREQLDRGYQHGGGWHPTKVKFQLNIDNSLYYPGDPVYQPLAMFKLRDETVFFYTCSWVAIVQKDRSFEVCRMD